MCHGCKSFKMKPFNSKSKRLLSRAQQYCQMQLTYIAASCGSKIDALNESYSKISLLIAEIDSMCLEHP